MDKSYMRGPYREGYDFYLTNKGQYRNPFPAGSPEHNEFERGWSQALKRFPISGDKIPKKPAVSREPTLAEKYAHSSQKRPSAPGESRGSYAAVKGKPWRRRGEG